MSSCAFATQWASRTWSVLSGWRSSMADLARLIATDCRHVLDQWTRAARIVWPWWWRTMAALIAADWLWRVWKDG